MTDANTQEQNDFHENTRDMPDVIYAVRLSSFYLVDGIWMEKPDEGAKKYVSTDSILTAFTKDYRIVCAKCLAELKTSWSQLTQTDPTQPWMQLSVEPCPHCRFENAKGIADVQALLLETEERFEKQAQIALSMSAALQMATMNQPKPVPRAKETMVRTWTVDRNFLADLYEKCHDRRDYEDTPTPEQIETVILALNDLEYLNLEDET